MARNAGRKPSIYLRYNTQILTIQEWSKLINPDYPGRAAMSIRDRIRQRNQGKPLTDEQVLFGIRATAEEKTAISARTIPYQLQEQIESWVMSAVAGMVPAIARNVIAQLENYIAKELPTLTEETTNEN